MMRDTILPFGGGRVRARLAEVTEEFADALVIFLEDDDGVGGHDASREGVGTAGPVARLLPS